MSGTQGGRIKVMTRTIIGASLALALIATSQPAAVAAADQSRSGAQSPAAPAVEPALRSWTAATGAFSLTTGSRVVASRAGLAGEARIFGADLSQIAGHRVPVVVAARARPGDIALSLTSVAPGNSAEGYRLRIGGSVSIEAANTTGLGRGEQTVEQMFSLDARHARIPQGVAVDWPNAAQRGVMIDAGRKYYQPGSVERLIRTAAWYKLNVVHLHLTEYNAFRLNSPKFPGLAAAQSYTRSDIDGFERTAARYHVTIVPEIDLPAHATAITNHWPATSWDCAAMNNERGHNFTLDVTKPATLDVVRKLLDAFIPWFKGPIFHIGTDEYPVESTQQNCPELVAYAKAHHFATTSDVMVHFIDDLNAIVRRHGKTAEAWGWWDAAGRPTISPDKNIIVEAYASDTDFGGRAGVTHFLDEGYPTVYADGNQLYVTPGLQLLPNDQSLYSQWPVVQNPLLRGYMMSRWSDNTETATDAFQEWYADRPQVVLADRAWGGPVQGTALDLENRTDRIGPPPGTTGVSADAVELTGSPYGSPALDPQHTASAVFDGDPTTFFDAADASGAYAGIDLGAGHSASVTKIRLLPRSNQPARMTGGSFQGCTDGPTSGCVTLATVHPNPATYDWRQLAVSDSRAYRWLRYVSPNGGYGNVAEVEFYASPAVDASIRLSTPASLDPLGTNTVTATVTNLTGRTLENAGVSVTADPVDGGAPLTVRAATSLPALAPHQSASQRWHIDVPLTVVPGVYRVGGTVTTTADSGVDRANTSALTSVAVPLTATVTPTPVTITTAGPATAALHITSNAAVPLRVRWEASRATGFAVSPRSAAVDVPAHGTASARLTITGRKPAPGVTTIPITVTSGRLRLADSSLQISVPYGALSDAFDNVGITSDGDVSPADLGGGIDGDGSSYSQQALAAGGAKPGLPFQHGGVSFTWPDVAPGVPDNVVADGQTVLIGKSGHTLGMLVAASYVAPGTFDGTGAVTYTDGTSTTFDVGIPEWQRGYSAPADEAIAMNYHNYAPAGQVTVATHIFFTGVALDPAKTVASITLPQAGGGRAALHIFALGLG